MLPTMLRSKPSPIFRHFLHSYLSKLDLKTVMATAVLNAFQDTNCYFSGWFLLFLFQFIFPITSKSSSKGKYYLLDIYHRKIEEYSPLQFCLKFVTVFYLTSPNPFKWLNVLNTFKFESKNTNLPFWLLHVMLWI